MAFNDITTLEHAATPLEENECLNAVIDAVNWAKPNAWFIRYGGATVALGAVVQCPYKRNLELVCTQAGTCADNLLDPADCVDGNEITDGTVKWKVRYSSAIINRGSNIDVDAQKGSFWFSSDNHNTGYVIPDDVGTNDHNVLHIGDTNNVQRDQLLFDNFKIYHRTDDVDGWKDWNIVEEVVEKGNNYIRYSSGIQICWGEGTANNAFVNVPLAKAFKNNTYGLSIASVARVECAGYIVSSATVAVGTTNTANTTIKFICIGYWK